MSIYQLDYYRNNLLELLGETTGEILTSCQYYYAISIDDSWIRRKVETIEFETERTLKRQLTLDIDYDRVNGMRRMFGQRGDNCYLPLPSDLDRTPLLSADIECNGTNISIAKRAENATIGAARLVGRITYELLNSYPNEPHNWSWVSPFLMWLIAFEYNTELYSIDSQAQSLKKANILPDKVAKVFFQDEILEEYRKYQIVYSLAAVIPCNSQHEDDVHSRTVNDRIGIVKLVRFESIDSSLARSQRGHPLITFSGIEYMVGLPLFGRGLRGCHARIVCPKGMIIDSVEIRCGSDLLPVKRVPGDGASSKYWSPHYGYSDLEDQGNAPSAANGATLEMIYNRKCVELHDRGLPSVKNVRAEFSESDYHMEDIVWQVRLNFSSRRSRFLIPTLALLTCTLFSLYTNMQRAIWLMNEGQTANTVDTSATLSTLGLPLLLGLLVAGEEHMILSRTLAGVRTIVGIATVTFILAACGLNANVQGGKMVFLYWAAMSCGIAAFIYVLWHIVRIQVFRCNQFESIRSEFSYTYHSRIDLSIALLYWSQAPKLLMSISAFIVRIKGRVLTTFDKQCRKCLWPLFLECLLGFRYGSDE
mgnify:FL=1